MSAPVVWRSIKRIITMIGKHRKPHPPGGGGGNGRVGQTPRKGGGNGPNVDGSIPIGKITKFGSIK